MAKPPIPAGTVRDEPDRGPGAEPQRFPLTMKLHILAAALFTAAACHAGIDPANFDTSVKPQDDFYQYAVGGWLKNTPIPADHAGYGSGYEVYDRNQAILRGIVEKAATAKDPGFIEKLVGDFYYSGMDLATVDSVGVAPLKAEFDRIAAIQSPSDLPGAVGHLQRIGVGVCLVFSSEQDPKDSNMVIAGMGQGGLGLPDRDYYLRDDDASKKVRDKYVAHVAKMLALAGDSPADAAAESASIMSLETALAKGSKTASDLRDPVANYHKMALADLGKLSPHFDWKPFLAAIGLDAPASLDVGQPDFVKALDAEAVAAPIANWRAYLRWHLIHDYARYLSTPYVNENFAFFGTTLNGTPTMRERAKRVLVVIDESVGEALGQLYVAQAFPPEAKARMLALVLNIKAALRERIQHLEWMDEPTRAAALVKLDAMGIKIGYPDKWIDYSTLVIDRGPYVLNVLRANEFATKRDLAKIGKPVDRTLWLMTPPTVNAYYDPPMNEIVFPAGFLQPPFFDASADDAVNYGAVGCVIGHEMTHGFDDEGRQFDAKGNLADWWSPQSEKLFKERSAAIVKQFSGYTIAGGLHVNGELTQGENIADLGGIKLSFTALEKVLAGHPQGKIDGFTPEQRFFLSFANVWRENQRPEAEKLQVNTDPHSPSRLRVNGPLSNLDEFAAAFGVPEGAPMRRAAADRVSIW
jgi:predicted metalloendopeptidase